MLSSSWAISRKMSFSVSRIRFTAARSSAALGAARASASAIRLRSTSW